MTTAGTGIKAKAKASPTSVLHLFLHQPRKLFLRRALFQIHLWAGLLLALYVVVIALSGAVLVFAGELNAALVPRSLTQGDSASLAGIPAVVKAARSACPGCAITMLTVPSPAMHVYKVEGKDERGHAVTLLLDPSAKRLLRQGRTWVDWVHDLHYYLLLGSAHGMQVNAAGGAILLLITVSGAYIWWPGVKQWRRSLSISFASRWRRINYDAHHAIGIWTLAIVFWWAFSGVYFGWYRQVQMAVNAISPLRGMVAPQLPPGAYTIATSERSSLEAILAAAQQASPAGHLYSLSDPTLAGATVTADMDLRAPGDFSHRDLVTIDTIHARVLSVWHYGSNHSAGDWILWAMHPIHFGTLWGTPVKIIWFLLGLSLAVLSVSGVVMYWNRYLRHRLAQLTRDM
jgi:uncharacterized iron-regulated membrane protein